MKTLLIILTTTILFATFGASCVKNEPNCGELPCPTATGANVLSCRINGKAYIAKGGEPDLGGLLGGCKQGCFISGATLGGAGFSINAYFCANGASGYSEKLHIYISDTMKIGDYILNLNNRVDYEGIGTGSVTNDDNVGLLTVTKITDNLIAGTFSFKGTSNFNFTEGNFDIAR